MIGKGNTAEVFAHGEGKVCKLFYKGYPKEPVLWEFHNARVLYREKLPVPAVYEVVEKEGRLGIVYERIYGKKNACAFGRGK